MPSVLDALRDNLLSPMVLSHVAEACFPHFAVVAWVEDVEVVRGDKYV